MDFTTSLVFIIIGLLMGLVSPFIGLTVLLIGTPDEAKGAFYIGFMLGTILHEAVIFNELEDIKMRLKEVERRIREDGEK